MNTTIGKSAGFVALSVLIAAPVSAQTVLEYETLEQRGSYLMGYGQGEQMKDQVGDVIDHEAYAAGLLDGLKGAEKVLSVQEVNAIMVEFNKRLSSAKGMSADVEIAFLEQNGKKEGVITTASGLQYMVLNDAGDTTVPRTASSVYSVHYKGQTLMGEVIENTREQSAPKKITNVSQLIPGFAEALSLMNPGDKYVVFIPSKLAYGSGGAGNLVPPNSLLVYDIDLIAIE